MSQLNLMIQAAPKPVLPRLRRALAVHRQRRIDRKVAETVLLLDHAGVVEDFLAARGRLAE